MTETERGVSVVVWRRAPRLEMLLLHRNLFGADFEGDWAWTSPGGAQDGDETAASAAQRELWEETGLRLDCTAAVSHVSTAQPGFDLAVFVAEASVEDVVVLSDEHDRYEWVELDEVQRCMPAWVAEMYREVLAHVPDP
jgi:8-oxo-dGTP pyrophosphatase MutT (NUDIX family)